MAKRALFGCVVFLATSAALAAPPATEGRRMDNVLAGCAFKAATVNLVGEQVMTRAAITAETIDRHSTAVRIEAGDPRLATLSETLKGMTLDAPAVPQPEIRMLVKIECADGRHHLLAGSRTGEDGRIDLTLDDKPASIHTPLRKMIEGIVG